MGEWGLYPWFRESGLDLIHPDDLAVVEAYPPYGQLYEVVGRDGKYLVFGRGELQFRGTPELFRVVPRPAFRYGQRVTTKAPRTVRIGVIRGICWHYKRNEPFFCLTVDGKRVSGRYWTDELEAV